MSRFTTPLLLEYLDGATWRVTAEFGYLCEILGRVIVIPENFLTDFASIPRPLWTLFPPTGRYGKAAVVHDWLYRTPGSASRAQADAVLREAMTVLQVPRVTRWILYAGVRLGGGPSYRGDDVPVTIDASGHPLI